VALGRTQSPLAIWLLEEERAEEGEGEETDRTSKTPSLPPTALGSAVPRKDVSGGLEG
jgi:hypothetical protein